MVYNTLQQLRRIAGAKGGTIRIPSESNKANQEDLSEYVFSKFASTYFQPNIPCQFSIRPLKSSVLDHPLPLDVISAQVSNQLLKVKHLRYSLSGNLDNNR